MRPLLFLGLRSDERAAEEEHHAVLRGLGLDERDVRRVRLEREGPGGVDELDGLDLDDWSGIVLGGGPWTLSDPPSKKSPAQRRGEAALAVLAERVIEADHPFLGCCYGIGTLGSRRGGVVDRTHGEPIGAVPVTLTDEGRADPLLGALPATFDAFVGHKEAVSRLPEGAVALASSPTCPVQAFRIGRHVRATQFHPELDVAGLLTRIEVYRDEGYFDAGELAALTETVRGAVVTHPPALLARFVDLYGG